MKASQRFIMSVGVFCFALHSLAQFSPHPTIQKQELDNSEYALLILSSLRDTSIGNHPWVTSDSTAYQLMLYNNRGQFKSEMPLRNIDSSGQTFHFGWVDYLNAFVVDSTTAYVYGVEMGYGSFPFVMCTENAGGSWEAVLFETDNERVANMNFQMVPNSLIMFTRDHGVLMQIQNNGRNQSVLLVLETQNGWRTYKQREVKLKSASTDHMEQLSFHYFLDGTIEIHLGRRSPSVLFQSIDKAKSFKRIVVEQPEG